MKTSVLNTIKGYLRSANQWFLKTPERALDEAYEAVTMIKAIEDAHFSGGKISNDYGNYSQSVQAYFQAELKKYLNIARVRLAEFNLSRSIVQVSSNRAITEIQLEEDSPDWYTVNVIDKPAVVLRKLKFIDEVLSRYAPERSTNSSSLVVLPESNSVNLTIQNASSQTLNSQKPVAIRKQNNRSRATASAEDIESLVDKTGVLPRSILKTVDRIKRELDPKAEAEVVETFRNSKARTVVALRLVLLLIIVPLLTQQLTKNFVIGPVIDRFRDNEQVEVFLNSEMEEEALDELQRFEQRLRFEILIGKIEPLTDPEIRERVGEQAKEIEGEYRENSNNSIKNVFADIVSACAFALILVNSKREIVVLKSFIDDLVYGLSDSAKAFIIILFTDIFVGFHSPHGWEVLLESISRHLGLPANRDFIFLFIATFPVILDTIFKYWIFRYLNRISPSAVATYRNMNE